MMMMMMMMTRLTAEISASNLR